MTNRSWLDRSRGFLGVFVVSILVVGLVGLAAAELPPGGTFIDDDGNVHEPYIEAIAAEGITKGCNPPTNDRYCPSDRVTRGQMAAFLVRALDLTEQLDDPFVDDDDSVFEADIEKLAAAGVTRGCNPPVNDRFCPNDYVTRGQMAAFLVRAMGYTDDGGGDLFIDDDDSVFEADIDRLGTAGVTKGCNPPSNNRFCPTDYVLRDQMASFLARALGLGAVTPPPPTTTTVPGVTTSTLPEVGSAWIGPCGGGSDDSRNSFYLDERCVQATVINSDWARISYPYTVSYIWYDPTGTGIGECPVSGECSVVDYKYDGASLIGWDFYFWVDGEDRDLGWHRFELWKGTAVNPAQELLLRKNFELLPIDPTTTTTTLPTTSWSCTVEDDGTRSCSGNTDPTDTAIETWSCTEIPSEDPYEDPSWECSGDIDKRGAGQETWACTSWGSCEGNVDRSDVEVETWDFSYLVAGPFIGEGNIDKCDSGAEEWQCEKTGTDELSCEGEFGAWEWTCHGTPGNDWSCTGVVGRNAPIVGPIPSAES